MINLWESYVPIGELRAGAVFETRDGVLAVKSQYHHDNGQCQCVLLASGEYAHFEFGDHTEVREIHLDQIQYRRPQGRPSRRKPEP